LPAATQQAQLIAILDQARELKLNAILLQVRPMSDALYASTREPWSQFLSGRQGVSPGYDPLEFAIREAHARGIELHAWINPFRAASNSNATLASNHVANSIPSGCANTGRSSGLIRVSLPHGSMSSVSLTTSFAATTSMVSTSTTTSIRTRSKARVVPRWFDVGTLWREERDEPG
jgi:hypothetical protein